MGIPRAGARGRSAFRVRRGRRCRAAAAPRKRKEKLAQAVALDRAAELSDSKGYNLSRKLRHRIEHLFGEAKQSHGLRRARYQGLEKMNEQVTLTAIAQNLKRLVKFLSPPGKRVPNQGAVRPKRPNFSLFSVCRAFLPMKSPWFSRIVDALSIHPGNPATQIT